MARAICALALVVALAAGTSAKDPALAKGIALVKDGDFEAAVLALDSVVRRLAASPRPDHDLTLGYLYLGIAYLELDQGSSARARFREALALEPGMRLDARAFSPQVIRVFEATRQESRTAAPPPAPAPAAAAPGPSPLPAPARTPSPEPRKRRSAIPWIVAGGGAAVAGTAAAIAGAGSTPTTTTLPTSRATTTTTTPATTTTTTTSTTTTTTTLPPSGCRYDLSPRTQDVPASGGGRSCQVSVAPANCRWTAESTDAWLQLTTPSGVGTRQVMFLVMANSGNQRRGRIRLVEDRSAQCEIEQEGR